MVYDFYPFPPSFKPYEHVDIADTRDLDQRYSPLVNPLKGFFILNCIKINGLINQFNLLFPLVIISTILYNFLINLLFNFLLCRNFTKTINTCPNKLLLKKMITLTPFLLLPLLCIIHSLIMVVFSSLDIFLRILWNHVGSSFKLITLNLLF